MADSVSRDDYSGRVAPVRAPLATGGRPARSWHYEAPSGEQSEGCAFSVPGRDAGLYGPSGQSVYSDGAGSLDVLG